jgi:hypothetical protein
MSLGAAGKSACATRSVKLAHATETGGRCRPVIRWPLICTHWQAFNVLNHTMFSAPDFGTLIGNANPQYNRITLGGSHASQSYTRIIQIGLSLSF